MGPSRITCFDIYLLQSLHISNKKIHLASLDLARTLASSAIASVEEEYCCSYSTWISTDLLLLPRSFLKEMIH
jgi:hypothetical protein